MADKWHNQIPDDSPLAMEYSDLKHQLTAANERADSLGDRYGRLIDQMVRILHAVRDYEGEQLSHEEIADRAIAVNDRAERYKAALEKIAGTPHVIGPSQFQSVLMAPVIAEQALNPIPSSDTGEND